jgi:hypothetical protein
MATAEKLKRERISRRCYTILKYYSEEYGVGTGSSEVFSDVLKSLIEDSQHLEKLLHSERSEDAVTEALAHKLLPEVRVTVAEQLAVALENCENAITYLELGTNAAIRAIANARSVSQQIRTTRQLSFESNLHQTTFPVVFTEEPEPITDSRLNFRNTDREILTTLITYIESVFDLGFNNSQKQVLHATVVRYLSAIQTEYWLGKVSKRQILNRGIFAIDKGLRELEHESKSLKKEKQRLIGKINKLDSATLR